MPDSQEILLNAIREHRASHTPKSWSAADRKLYSALPEVAQSEPDDDDGTFAWRGSPAP